MLESANERFFLGIIWEGASEENGAVGVEEKSDTEKELFEWR